MKKELLKTGEFIIGGSDAIFMSLYIEKDDKFLRIHRQKEAQEVPKMSTSNIPLECV